ncbi:MAG: type I restriction enzyme HsdR N-terminal domain-containing protein [Desulfobacteraceae bacterium]|nr:type I restriction enzyme HsdR N-terminal domain-containing protein [Desulfobacteraceae bacterium]
MEDTLVDYITGKTVPNLGPEESRQMFERILVEQKGYAREDVRVDEPITVVFQGKEYQSTVDLVVFLKDRAVMAVRCVAGSLGSYEREILAGARLLYDYQVPFSVSTNGKDALVREVVTGKKHGEGIDAVPSRQEALDLVGTLESPVFPEEKKEREMIIFRSYNLDKYRDECSD